MNPRIQKAYKFFKLSLKDRFLDCSVDMSDKHLDQLTTHLIIEALAKADKPYSDIGLMMLLEDIIGCEINDNASEDTEVLSFNTLRDL